MQLRQETGIPTTHKKNIPYEYWNMSVPIDRHQYVYLHIMLSLSFPAHEAFFFLLSLLPYLSINQAEYFEREANNAGASLTMQVMEKRWEMRADFMCQIL